MSLLPGTRLGPYEIVSLIGIGGMGEVYRARQASLDRDVALKVLPAAVARDADRLARFQREARVLGRLNHPNIAQVFDLEESDGVTAIVMELVEGDSLDFLLATGPRPVDESIRLATQICDALEAAHAQGIVHRDLKPANIKVRPDGTVKVLDFGLAKPGSASAAAETVTVDATAPGTVLGTVAYMAPEQAKGQDVGPQADIWAFGCVLFEMLTGTRAFGRDTAAETIASVIGSTPDFERLPPATPRMVRRVIERCLEKDMRDRMHHIGDARADLRDARSESVVGFRPRRPPARRVAALAGAAAAIVIVFTAGWWSGRSSPVASAPIRLAMPFVERTIDLPFGVSRIAISSDGDRIAYAGSGQLWMRRLRDKDPQGLGVPGFSPFFSPNGQWVALFTGERLVKIPVGGGEPTVLTQTTERFGGGVWLENGTIIFATNGGLYRVADTGGTAELVVAPDRAKGEQLFSSPAALPDGGRVLITIASGTTPPDFTTAAVDLGTRAITRVLEHASAARYVNTGHLLYASKGGLKAAGFNSRTLEVSSPALDLADLNVGVTADNGVGDYAVALSGTVAFLPQQARQRLSTLVWADRDGTEEPMAVEAGQFWNARVSPDGRQIALDVRRGTNRDIWILDVARLTQTRLTDGPTEDVLPMWSPDGRRVFFGSDRQGNFDVYSQAADGASQATLEFGGPGFQVPDSLTPPDGRTLVLLEDYRAMRLVDLSGTRALTPLLGENFVARLGQVSPNGRWIAYESNESGGEFEIYVRPFPNVKDGREKVSIAGGRYPVWSAKGKGDELFYLQPDGHMMVAPVATSGAFSVGRVQRLFRTEPPVPRVSGRSYDVSPIDGRFLLLKSQPSADPGPTNVSVILNWFQELRARARASKPD